MARLGRTTRSFAVVVAVGLGGVSAAHAGTIDNTSGFGSGTDGADRTAGGTFLADDERLFTFTLELKDITGGTTVAAVVYATDGSSTPTGSPIWSGTPFALSGTRTVFQFTPSVGLVSGSHYFVGVTSRPGVVAGTSGGTQNFRFFIQGSSLASPAQAWSNFTTDLAPTTGNAGADIRSTIVTNPEPGTWALFGLGLAGLAVFVRRRRRRSLAHSAAEHALQRSVRTAPRATCGPRCVA